MSVKRFLLSSLLATLIFIGGVLVGKHILSAPIEIVVIDVDKLVWLMEKYNALADEIKKEFKLMKEWNENALIEPPEFQPEKEDKK